MTGSKLMKSEIDLHFWFETERVYTLKSLNSKMTRKNRKYWKAQDLITNLVATFQLQLIAFSDRGPKAVQILKQFLIVKTLELLKLAKILRASIERFLPLIQACKVQSLIAIGWNNKTVFNLKRWVKIAQRKRLLWHQIWRITHLYQRVEGKRIKNFMESNR